MKKCNNCGSKELKESGKIFICLTCHEVISNLPKIDALKKLFQIQEKNNTKKAYNEAMEQLQKRRTAENIARRKLKES